jgi:hypothetical protein
MLSRAKNESFGNNRLEKMTKGAVIANLSYYCEMCQKGHRKTEKDVSDPITRNILNTKHNGCTIKSGVRYICYVTSELNAE